MQQIFRQYARLSSNPGNRAALYTALFDLSIDLGVEEVNGITSWLKNDGNPRDFPVPRPANPVITSVEDVIKWSHPEDEHEARVESEEQKT